MPFKWRPFQTTNATWGDWKVHLPKQPPLIISADLPHPDLLHIMPIQFSSFILCRIKHIIISGEKRETHQSFLRKHYLTVETKNCFDWKRSRSKRCSRTEFTMRGHLPWSVRINGLCRKKGGADTNKPQTTWSGKIPAASWCNQPVGPGPQSLHDEEPEGQAQAACLLMCLGEKGLDVVIFKINTIISSLGL